MLTIHTSEMSSKNYNNASAVVVTSGRNKIKLVTALHCQYKQAVSRL